MPQVEGISIDEEGLAYLGELSEGTSLRHAVQLLTPAATLAATNGRDDVTRVDLEEVPERIDAYLLSAAVASQDHCYLVSMMIL